MDSNSRKHKSATMATGNRQVRVCLMGAPFDTNNRGVSALAYSLVKLVKEVIPNAKISI